MKNEITLDMAWDYLVEAQIATQEELELVCCINGMNFTTLDDVVYARTAYRSIRVLMEDTNEK